MFNLNRKMNLWEHFSGTVAMFNLIEFFLSGGVLNLLLAIIILATL